MSLAGGGWLTYEAWRLLIQAPPEGAIDLFQRHTEIQEWYAGVTVYGIRGTAVYPPASYAMLWPLIGWLGFEAARWFWALTTVLSLAALVAACLVASRASDRLERTFTVLVPPLHVRDRRDDRQRPADDPRPWRRSPGGRSCWRARRAGSATRRRPGCSCSPWSRSRSPHRSSGSRCSCPGRPRPALLAIGGYVLLTLAGAAPTSSSPVELMGEWYGRRDPGCGVGRIARGHLQRPHLAGHAGRGRRGERGTRPTRARAARAGARSSRAAGCRPFRSERSSRSAPGCSGSAGVDRWYLLGVSAVVARLWTYHNWYDDLLILFPMVALLRVALSRNTPSPSRAPRPGWSRRSCWPLRSP